MDKVPNIWIISDDTHRIRQAEEILRHLGGQAVVFSAAALERAGSLSVYRDAMAAEGMALLSPSLAIGAGGRAARWLGEIKSWHPDCLTVQLLNPGPGFKGLDRVVAPSWEPVPPYPSPILTHGLINPVNPGYLAAARRQLAEDLAYGPLAAALSSLPHPLTALLVGGRFAGGDVTAEDMRALTALLQQPVEEEGGSFLVTISARTDRAVASALRVAVPSPCFFYDPAADRHMPNPYKIFLALADRIVVTGDSVRMLSEACSAGKPVWIWAAAGRFQPYAALHRELVESGYARMLTPERVDKDWSGWLVPPPLDEARRVAEFIREAGAQRGIIFPAGF